jgi:hypothetical protein
MLATEIVAMGFYMAFHAADWVCFVFHRKSIIFCIFNIYV